MVEAPTRPGRTRRRRGRLRPWLPAALAALAVVAAACGGGPTATTSRTTGTTATGTQRQRTTGTTSAAPSTTVPPSTTTTTNPAAAAALPPPGPLPPFVGTNPAGWVPAGRTVDGVPAVYETSLVPPGGSAPAGIAWMDTKLLQARLYSGSESPGGGPYQYTAPIQPADAATLVAAFNGGFKMAVAGGGYYTEGRQVVPLQTGSASLVIYADGTVNVGAWGTDVTMTPNVVAVRQNLVPLVEGGSPTAAAQTPNWGRWGATCGVSSCTGAGVENQWRSGAGVTADGALVYVTGPTLAPIQLAQLLVQAGVVRGMQLDINPDWTVLVTYAPTPPNAPATPTNGSKLVASTVQGPWTFFEPSWARDFVTMSARSFTAG